MAKEETNYGEMKHPKDRGERRDSKLTLFRRKDWNRQCYKYAACRFFKLRFGFFKDRIKIERRSNKHPFNSENIE